jgi:hypothetical protein
MKLHGLLGAASDPPTYAQASAAPDARMRSLRLAAAEIAASLEMPLSTPLGAARARGPGPPLPPTGAGAAQPLPPQRAGELLHLDVTKLGRTARPGHRMIGRTSQRGWQRAYQLGREYVHVCVDDASRLAYVEVLADERAESAAAFLERRSPGIERGESGSSG